MSGFINTKYFDAQESIQGFGEDLVQNPFYLFNDKKGIRVTWLNTNLEKSTLDPGSKLAYSQLGKNSPIRYNKINGLYIYQFPRIEFEFDEDEFGMQNVPIEGESFLLPNIITPYDGDMFIIEHIKGSRWLFKADKVQMDTFENGANAYKFHWSLDRTTDIDTLNNVLEDEFIYMDVEEGTNLKAVVRLDKYEKAKKLDELGITLSNYFYEMFYNQKVQTFIYHWYNNYNMYDPFIIEFIRRNKILSAIESKIIVTHMTVLESTFSLDYNRTLYRAFELKDKNRLSNSQYRSQADYIGDMSTIFYSMFDSYFALNYKVLSEENGPLNPRDVIPILDQEFIERIVNNDKYDCCDDRRFLNIIISYFNNESVYYDGMENNLEIFEYSSNDDHMTQQIFYRLILCIFCIDQETKKLLS